MSIDQYERDLNRLVADVRTADQPAALLIGAGCSVSAGIPSAGGIARQIQKDYAVEADGYAECMDALEPYQQKRILRNHIEEAKFVRAGE